MQILNSPAHQAAMARFAEHDHQIAPVFNSLDMPFDFVEAVQFLLGSETFRALPEEGEVTKGKVAGLITAFIVVLEEQRRIDRQRLRVVRSQERKKK